MLHRGCNAMLGHIENNRARNLMAGARLFRFLRGVVEYLMADYSHMPHHPLHRTADEKRIRANKLATKRRKAKKELNASGS